MQWQLEWKIYRAKSNTPIDNCNMVLILGCIPKPEFATKMGDVWVSIGLTLYSGDPMASNSMVIHDVPFNRVQLTKAAKYQCVLVRDYRVQLIQMLIIHLIHAIFYSAALVPSLV